MSINVIELEIDYNEKKDLITELVFEEGISKMILEYEGIKIELDILKNVDESDIIFDYLINDNDIVNEEFISKYGLNDKTELLEIGKIWGRRREFIDLDIKRVYKYFENDYIRDCYNDEFHSEFELTFEEYKNEMIIDFDNIGYYDINEFLNDYLFDFDKWGSMIDIFESKLTYIREVYEIKKSIDIDFIGLMDVVFKYKINRIETGEELFDGLTLSIRDFILEVKNDNIDLFNQMTKYLEENNEELYEIVNNLE